MYDVLLYGMLELALGVDPAVDNPYDPALVVVDVQVERPDGSVQSWPAFYDGEGWRWRYRPLLEGEHRAMVWLNGEAVDSFVFHVEPSQAPGPIRPEGWGFRHADGSPFVPLGLNLGWADQQGPADYERWFEALAAQGGSFARIWLTHFSDQDPEWPALGRMDPEASANLDAIFDLAAAHGLLLMPVLWQHSELQSAMWSSWDGNPYNEANGGPCADSACFFEDPEALALQLAFLRSCVARWGAHPALAAWEVMNEIDGIEGVDSDVTAAWAAAHAETIRTLEGGLHPVSFSYALPPQAVSGQVWEGADFVQVHSYLLSDVEPVVQGVGASLAAWDAPVLVGEWGLDWMGNGDRADHEGLAWHNASWAAVASGSAGNALSWWWDDHIEPDDLWWRLDGLATVVATLDLPSMAPVAVALDDDDLEAWARSDGEVTLVWIHDREHSPPDAEVRRYEGVRIALSHGPARVRVVDTSSGATVDEGCSPGGPGLTLPVALEGDLAVILSSDCCDCDHETEGCACQSGGSRGALGLALLPLLAVIRRARRECLGGRCGMLSATTRR